MEDIKRELLISYLTWNILKIKSLNNIEPSCLKDVASSIKKSLRNKKLDELIECAKNLSFNTNAKFFDMLNDLNWTKTKVEPKDVGVVMPEMGDLPKCALKGNLIDTANFVKQHKCYKSSQYIERLTKICDILEEFLPILIDTSYHNQRKDAAENTKYYIEDGNHRALAYILCGHNELIAFIGSNK